MNVQDQERWETARQAVIERWRGILKKIDERDEGGVLALANIIDEFCEEAVSDRLDVLHGQAPPEVDVLKFSGSGLVAGTRCLFCRGFQEDGGCFGLLSNLNRQVLAGRWEEARHAAEVYIERLEALRLAGAPAPRRG